MRNAGTGVLDFASAPSRLQDQASFRIDDLHYLSTRQHPQHDNNGGNSAMAKKRVQKTQKKRGAGKAKASPELNAVIDDLVVGNRILYVQDVVDGYGHISARHPHH